VSDQFKLNCAAALSEWHQLGVVKTGSGTVQLEIWPEIEAALLIEMVMN